MPEKCLLKPSTLGCAVQSTTGVGFLKETVLSQESLNEFFREGGNNVPLDCFVQI